MTLPGIEQSNGPENRPAMITEFRCRASITHAVAAGAEYPGRRCYHPLLARTGCHSVRTDSPDCPPLAPASPVRLPGPRRHVDDRATAGAPRPCALRQSPDGRPDRWSQRGIQRPGEQTQARQRSTRPGTAPARQPVETLHLDRQLLSARPRRYPELRLAGIAAPRRAGTGPPGHALATATRRLPRASRGQPRAQTEGGGTDPGPPPPRPVPCAHQSLGPDP